MAAAAVAVPVAAAVVAAGKTDPFELTESPAVRKHRGAFVYWWSVGSG